MIDVHTFQAQGTFTMIRVAFVCLALCGLVDKSWAEEIAGPVGEELANDSADVLTVQILLNQVPSDAGGPESMLVPDGLIGPQTLAAIRRFQLKQFGRDGVDGRVIPGKRTFAELTRIVVAQPLPDRIASVARGEQLYWRDGSLRETEPRVSKRLQQYWEAVGVEVSVEQLQQQEFQASHPWSAAFVSWVVKRAGGGDDFAYSAAHWRYVAAAKQNRLANNDNPFNAYRIAECKVGVGDIVVKRRGTSTATYDNIERGHQTHGDIVLAVSDSKALTVGGNVGNTVSVTEVNLTTGGHLSGEPYFAVVNVQPQQ